MSLSFFVVSQILLAKQNVYNGTLTSEWMQIVDIRSRLLFFTNLKRCLVQGQCGKRTALPSTLGSCCLTRILFFGSFQATWEFSCSNTDPEYQLLKKVENNLAD